MLCVLPLLVCWPSTEHFGGRLWHFWSQAIGMDLKTQHCEARKNCFHGRFLSLLEILDLFSLNRNCPKLHREWQHIHCQRSWGPFYKQFQNCGDVALGHDQWLRHWKVIQEFSLPVSGPTSAVYLLMLKPSASHFTSLRFLCCKLFGARARSQYIFTVLSIRSILAGLFPGTGVIYNNRIMWINLSPTSFLSQIQVFVSNTPTLGIFYPPKK